MAARLSFDERCVISAMVGVGGLAPPVVVGDRPLLVVKFKRPHGGGGFYYGTASFVRGALSDRGAG